MKWTCAPLHFTSSPWRHEGEQGGKGQDAVGNKCEGQPMTPSVRNYREPW